MSAPVRPPIVCPVCASTDVYADTTCHTWPGGTRADGTVTWMACQGCGSAMRYGCFGCGWTYTHGLNPNNPRAAANASARPPWIDPDHDYDEILAPGWEWPEDSYLARPAGWTDPEAQEGGSG